MNIQHCGSSCLVIITDRAQYGVKMNIHMASEGNMLSGSEGGGASKERRDDSGMFLEIVFTEGPGGP